jgi:hypothetical protein
VVLRLESGGFVSALFGYKGTSEIGATDGVRGFGAMLGYGYESDETTLRFSLGWSTTSPMLGRWTTSSASRASRPSRTRSPA